MKKYIVISLFAAAAFCVFWFFFALRSYVVMGVYSEQHSQTSVMRENGFQIDMPAAAGWYPFMLTYNADGFAGWSGIDARMSIMYDFGAFDASARTSSIYDTQSDKYSSFYGAYVIRKNGGVFGFDGDEIDLDEVTLAVKYDYTQLVLANFGCADPIFSASDFRTIRDVRFAGSEGWTRVDAQIETNGVAHSFEEEKTAYLQYGPPVETPEEDFAAISLSGRIYARYFEEYGCTVMIYIIAPNAGAVESAEPVLEQTVISSLQQ